MECGRSEEHTSELQSLRHLVCRLLLEKKKKKKIKIASDTLNDARAYVTHRTAIYHKRVRVMRLTPNCELSTQTARHPQAMCESVRAPPILAPSAPDSCLSAATRSAGSRPSSTSRLAPSRGLPRTHCSP